MSTNFPEPPKNGDRFAYEAKKRKRTGVIGLGVAAVLVSLIAFYAFSGGNPRPTATPGPVDTPTAVGGISQSGMELLADSVEASIKKADFNEANAVTKLAEKSAPNCTFVIHSGHITADQKQLVMSDVHNAGMTATAVVYRIFATKTGLYAFMIAETC